MGRKKLRSIAHLFVSSSWTQALLELLRSSIGILMAHRDIVVGRHTMVLPTPNSSARCRVLSMTYRNAVMLEPSTSSYGSENHTPLELIVRRASHAAPSRQADPSRRAAPHRWQQWKRVLSGNSSLSAVQSCHALYWHAMQAAPSRRKALSWLQQWKRCTGLITGDSSPRKREGNLRFPMNLHGVRRSARPTSRWAPKAHCLMGKTQ